MDIDIELWDNKTITSGLKNYLRWGGPASCRSAVVSRSPLWAGSVDPREPRGVLFPPWHSLFTGGELAQTGHSYVQCSGVYMCLFQTVNLKVCDSLWVLNNNFCFILDPNSGLHILFIKHHKLNWKLKKKETIASISERNFVPVVQ